VKALTTERDPFEAAVDAIVTGDLSTLESLLRAHPDLVRARSSRVHRATLLHYVSANGVEDYRQRTPPNAVAVARLLLEAGGEVDAVAETYGGGSAQTTMNLLVSSCHPAEAGLQSALAEVLLDFGAAANGLDDDGSPLMTALAFGYPEVAETLAARGARVDNILAAAGLGRLDLVRSYVVPEPRQQWSGPPGTEPRESSSGGGLTLAPGVSLTATRWMNVPGGAKAHIERAFVWACAFGRNELVDYLLGKGVDPAAKDVDDMTGLHWAAANLHLEVVRSLLQHGAPLEVKNHWGGTVLDSTVYFARQQPADSADYVPVIEILIAAGADVNAVTPCPTGNAILDDLLNPQLPPPPSE